MERLTGAKNALVKNLRQLKDKKTRDITGHILVEGEVMLREALACGLKMHELVGDEAHEALLVELEASAARTVCVPRAILESICETKTPQGVCAVFDRPAPTAPEDLPDLVVALDGVQDPGNLGTIWRTADAAGFGALLLGAGCADALSPKVLRAAMGSGFRLPYAQVDPLEETLRMMQQRGYTVLASDLSGEDFYARRKTDGKIVLVIGSEAHGIRPVIRELADERVKLPMRGGAESLNAAIAAAIMMYDIVNAQ